MDSCCIALNLLYCCVLLITGIKTDSEQKGVIPNSFDHIFSHIARTENQQYLVRASFLEIYMVRWPSDGRLRQLLILDSSCFMYFCIFDIVIVVVCESESCEWALCGLWSCRNRACSVFWPDIIKCVPNQGVDCLVC